MTASDSLDQSATMAFLLRWVRASNARAYWEGQRTVAEENLRAVETHLQELQAGFRALGLDIIDPAVWSRLTREYGPEVGRILDAESGVQATEAKRQEPKPQVDLADTVNPKRPAIRDLVLTYLRGAGADGMKAAAIRALIEKTWGGSIHEKTVGMTLFRLSRERKVRRDGHTWFFVQPKAETKNPGAVTPGSYEDMIN